MEARQQAEELYIRPNRYFKTQVEILLDMTCIVYG